MGKAIHKQQSRQRRHARIRARVKGTATKPRLAVYRSNQAIYAQLIDDVAATTLAAADSRNVAGTTLKERATATGAAIAEAAKKLKIEEVVFDRGGFQYAGSVAALADGAREGGLKF